jgi:Tfp pilus assembly PilM family ATPase
MASRIFAVDLGAWSVKLAIASPGIRGATLVHVAERQVPPGDDPADVRAKATLVQMIDELGLRDGSGYVGVYGDQVFTQVLDFGFKNLRRAELDKAVGGELEGVVPVDLEEMVYCFEPIPAPPATESTADVRGRVAPPPEGMRVLSYAMRRDRAEQIVGLGPACHFDVRGVLACAGAAVRLVERTPSLAKARHDGPVAVIDIGHERTDVVVVAGGKAVFSRSVPRAGKQVTQAIAKAYKLDWTSAERGKHADGVVGSQLEPLPSDKFGPIHNAIVGELTAFARDLRQTLAACRARTGYTAQAALLVGGGARLRGIGSFLAEQLGITAWRPTPDDVAALAGPKIGVDKSRELPIDAAAMTIGMAYDAAGGRPSFDLRSGALAAKMDLSFLRAKAVSLVAALLAVALFAAGAAYADLYRLRKAEKVLLARFATEANELFGQTCTKPDSSRCKIGEKDCTCRDKTVEEVLDTKAGAAGAASSPLPKQTAYDVLIEVSAHVPPKDKVTIDIQHIDIGTDKIELAGTAKKPNEIDMLVDELKKVPCFTKVDRGPTTVSGELQSFSINIAAQCMQEHP